MPASRWVTSPSPKSVPSRARSACRRPTSRRARRCASCLAVTTARRAAPGRLGLRSPVRSSMRAASGWGARRRGWLHGGPAQGHRGALGSPRYVTRIDAASNTIVLGRREDLETRTIPLEKVTFVDGAPPSPDTRSRPFRAAVRIRHPGGARRGDGPTGEQGRTDPRRPLDRRDRRVRLGAAPARPPCSTTATSVSAAAASPMPPRIAMTGDRMSIGPAPILALLVGGFHTALYVFIPATPVAACR